MKIKLRGLATNLNFSITDNLLLKSIIQAITIITKKICIGTNGGDEKCLDLKRLRRLKTHIKHHKLRKYLESKKNELGQDMNLTYRNFDRTSGEAIYLGPKGSQNIQNPQHPDYNDQFQVMNYSGYGPINSNENDWIQ